MGFSFSSTMARRFSRDLAVMWARSVLKERNMAMMRFSRSISFCCRVYSFMRRSITSARSSR